MYIIIRCLKTDMWQTRWPHWIYKQFDVNLLAERVAKKVNMLCKSRFLIFIFIFLCYIFIIQNTVGSLRIQANSNCEVIQTNLGIIIPL